MEALSWKDRIFGLSGAGEDSRQSNPSILPQRAGIVDAVVLYSLLLLINYFFSGDDIGWILLNPSPWFLLPVFMGARYGLRMAVIGAAATALTILVVNQFQTGDLFSELFEERAYFFLALLIVGVVASLGNYLLAGPAQIAESQRGELEDANARLSETVGLLHQNEARLKVALLKHNASFASIPDDFQRMFKGGIHGVDSGLLTLLRRQFGVRSAAIYTMKGQNDESLVRRSVAGDEGDFVQSIQLGEQGGVVRAALDTGRLVTCRHIWEETAGDPDDVLAALPWVHCGKIKALLVFRRMDFEEIYWENFARIQAVWGWVMGHVGDAVIQGEQVEYETARLVSEEEFQRDLEMARQLEQSLYLGFRVLVFAQGKLDSADQMKLVALLQRQAGPGNVIVQRRDSEENSELWVLVAEADNYAAEKLAEFWLKGTGGKDSITCEVEVRPLRQVY